jgi:hypothetical protein
MNNLEAFKLVLQITHICISIFILREFMITNGKQ